MIPAQYDDQHGYDCDADPLWHGVDVASLVQLSPDDSDAPERQSERDARLAELAAVFREVLVWLAEGLDGSKCDDDLRKVTGVDLAQQAQAQADWRLAVEHTGGKAIRLLARLDPSLFKDAPENIRNLLTR